MKKFLALSILAFGIFATSASASTGSFARATVSPDWKTGNFEVSGSSSVCSLGGCSWFPVVIAMPSLPEYRCGYGGEEAFDSDPNTQVIWSGLPARSSDGPFSAQVANAAILNGVYGQRLCLALIGSHLVKDVVCEAQAPIFGYDPSTCVPVNRVFEENLASILPSVEVPEPAVTAATTPAPTTEPPAVSPPQKKFRCPKGQTKGAARREAQMHPPPLTSPNAQVGEQLSDHRLLHC